MPNDRYVPDVPDLIPVDTAAREFGRSRRLIFSWIRLGRLKRYRAVGDRQTYVDRNELKRLTRPRHEPPRQSGDSKQQ
jgi:hypothetical protein